jgi:hypothetical protein
VQEQQQMINNQDEKIAALVKQNAALLKRVEDLEINR